MDDKMTMEKRYGQLSPLPSYENYRDNKRVSSLMPDFFRNRSRPSIIAYVLAIISIALIITYGSPLHRIESSARPASSSILSASNHTNLVELEAHVMSKCPDARDCLRDLVVPAMEQIVDKVDFRLSYIGKIDDKDTIQCMHGATECLGNMLGLCANELFPNNTKISLGFTNCLIMSYQRIPARDLVQSCALEHGISFDELNACISEEGKGLDLLEASVERSQKAGVKKSCTIRVGGEQWCVRDGGKWKECGGGHEVKDLVKEVNRRYNAT